MSSKARHGRLWITRTRPQAEATAERLRALGWTPVVAPVLETRALDASDAALMSAEGGGEAYDLAFTSQAAVAAFAALRGRRDLRVFVVGHATGRAASEAGFTKVEGPRDGEAGDVEALAARIALASPRPGLLLNPTAREPAADLEALLAQRGISARSVAVYETVETPLAPPPENLEGLLVHSPGAARALARLIPTEVAAALSVWAISEAAAAPLRPLGFKQIFVAERPHEAAMLAQLHAHD